MMGNGFPSCAFKKIWKSAHDFVMPTRTHRKTQLQLDLFYMKFNTGGLLLKSFLEIGDWLKAGKKISGTLRE
jgi:hypothetical protein